MLNSGFMILLKILAKYFGIFVFVKISVAIKNGKSDGTTELAHSFNPDFVACKLVEENNIKHMVNIRNIAEIIFRFILNTNIWKFFTFNTFLSYYFWYIFMILK